MIYQPEIEFERISAISELTKSIDKSKVDILDITKVTIDMIDMIQQNIKKSFKKSNP